MAKGLHSLWTILGEFSIPGIETPRSSVYHYNTLNNVVDLVLAPRKTDVPVLSSFSELA